MKIAEVCELIEQTAPLALQENYDNAGLLIGDRHAEVKGVLLTIDVTEPVIDEAVVKGCNLIVAHHPLIFKGLKRITGKNEVERCVVKAIKNDVAIYAAHTNMDNAQEGVNRKIADLLGLKDAVVLQPMSGLLLKLVTFVPKLHYIRVRDALFAAGAGVIGDYDACSYSSEGNGTFRAGESAHPFVGQVNVLHTELEIRMEMILPVYLKNKITSALIHSHPYEEPAYDFVPLANEWSRVGAGMIGCLEQPIDELTFLRQLKDIFNARVVRHTACTGRKITKVAVCGGAGSSFLNDAIAQEADAFISGDFKYHEFFDAENRILIADIGHYESEQFTKDIFYEIITKKIANFAVRISEINTNPINYL